MASPGRVFPTSGAGMEADPGKDATVISFFMYKCFLEFGMHLFNFQGTE